MLDLVNCTNVTVVLTAPIPTITVEKSTGCRLLVPEAWGADDIGATGIRGRGGAWFFFARTWCERVRDDAIAFD